jgi:kynurenine formamidase
VLVRTGWDRRFPSDRYFRAGPFLADTVVRRLIDGAVVLVGVDFGNVDDTTDPARPVHTALLAAGIPIVEHLVHLDQLPTAGFRLFAPVLAVRGAAAMPVRVFAELPAADAMTSGAI